MLVNLVWKVAWIWNFCWPEATERSKCFIRFFLEKSVGGGNQWVGGRPVLSISEAIFLPSRNKVNTKRFNKLREAIVARANQFNILMVPEPRFLTLWGVIWIKNLAGANGRKRFGTRGLSKIRSHNNNRELRSYPRKSKEILEKVFITKIHGNGIFISNCWF